MCPAVGCPFDGRVRALVFVHEAHRLGPLCRPPAYAGLPVVREPAHQWSGKGLNCLTARRSTAARSANNGLTTVPWRKRESTDTQELLCNLTGRGDHLTLVRSPRTDEQTTCDGVRAWFDLARRRLGLVKRPKLHDVRQRCMRSLPEFHVHLLVLQRPNV